jgi:hypothetical protein
VTHGRSHQYYEIETNADCYRREVHLGIIDHIIQELKIGYMWLTWSWLFVCQP